MIEENPAEWSSAEIIMQQYMNWGSWPAEVEDSPITTMVLGYGAMYNHSDDPNIEAWQNLNDNTMSFVALKDIEPGEELCHYYPNWVFGYDRGLDE